MENDFIISVLGGLSALILKDFYEFIKNLVVMIYRWAFKPDINTAIFRADGFWRYELMRFSQKIKRKIKKMKRKTFNIDEIIR